MVSFFPDKSKRSGRTALGDGVARGLSCGIGGGGFHIISGDAKGARMFSWATLVAGGEGKSITERNKWDKNIYSTIQKYASSAVQ
jgi:hypothetical protein